jgi:hypothetical protein
LTNLCQPLRGAACVERNWRPEAHVYMMRLPQRYLTKDRLLVDALTANGLVCRMGVRVVPTALGIQTFMAQYRFCCPTPVHARRGFPSAARCDARPTYWRPDPGSVSFRNPCHSEAN